MEQNYVTDTLCSLLYFAVLRLCTCFYLNFSGHLLGWVLPLGVLSAFTCTMSMLLCCCYLMLTHKLTDWLVGWLVG